VPFLNIGFICEYFNRVGNTPVYDLLHMRCEMMKGRLIFNIFIGISSEPCEFFHLRDLIISPISLVNTGVKFYMWKESNEHLKNIVKCTIHSL
jgi:hypothetical protein